MFKQNSTMINSKRGVAPLIIAGILLLVIGGIYGSLIYFSNKDIDTPLPDEQQSFENLEEQFNFSDDENSSNKTGIMSAPLLNPTSEDLSINMDTSDKFCGFNPTECDNFLTNINHPVTVFLGKIWCKARNVFWLGQKGLGINPWTFTPGIIAVLFFFFLTSTIYSSMAGGGSKVLTWIMFGGAFVVIILALGVL